MPTALDNGFRWRTDPHHHDPFHINSHRKVHTLYYLDTPIACIEPSGRGLIARFLAHHFETPERPVAVVSVQKGKCFVQNWVRPRQSAVMADGRYRALLQSPRAALGPR